MSRDLGKLLNREKRIGNLMTVNVGEAWRKLTTRQFANEPGRCFEELVSNAVDSYAAGTPLERIRLALSFSGTTASVTNWGEGMTLEQIRCLLTLGGTDKSFDGDTIGQFGMGFCSVFNPQLATESVVVTTRCEGNTVRIVFNVEKQGKPPRITAEILKKRLRYATRVECRFAAAESVGTCKSWAEDAVRFYPYAVTLDGKKVRSVWAGNADEYVLAGEGVRARIYPSAFAWVNVLCRYVQVMTISLEGFLTGGHNRHGDLRDYRRFPYYPGVAVDINIDKLNLTVSRNQFYLDSVYSNAKKELALAVKGRLLRALADSGFRDGNDYESIIWNNLYIFRSEMRDYIKAVEDGTYEHDPACLESVLFDTAVFEIVGKREFYSLHDIAARRTRELPLFHCKEEYGKTVLGGRFKHDFIIVEPPRTPSMAPRDYFHEILDNAFSCRIVNLDTLHREPDTIKKLVRAGIIDGEMLVRRQKLCKKRRYDAEETRLLGEINEWMRRPNVAELLKRNLTFPVETIEVGLFETAKDEEDITAALFDQAGETMSLSPEEILECDQLGYVCIGLNARSSLWERLKKSHEPYRMYYIFSIVVRELTLTQKVIPFSRRYYYMGSRIETELVDVLKQEIEHERT